MSRFVSGALPAQRAGFPALTIGGAAVFVDESPSPTTMRAVLELGLALADLVDGAVAALASDDGGA